MDRWAQPLHVNGRIPNWPGWCKNSDTVHELRQLQQHNRKLSGLASKVITGATIASGIAMASKSIEEIDVVIGDVSSQRATFGAVTNRLTHAVDNLTNVKTNKTARSRILDTDYASATSELARTQIIQQADAMLAQANALPQTVLALCSDKAHAALV